MRKEMKTKRLIAWEKERRGEIVSRGLQMHSQLVSRNGANVKYFEFTLQHDVSNNRAVRRILAVN